MLLNSIYVFIQEPCFQPYVKKLNPKPSADGTAVSPGTRISVSSLVRSFVPSFLGLHQWQLQLRPILKYVSLDTEDDI